MTTAHTPGPWAAIGTDVKTPGPRSRILCWTGQPEVQMGEARANAQLIAAAPDLLAALRAMLAKHDDRDAPSDLWPAEAAQARAAIAKAGG